MKRKSGSVFGDFAAKRQLGLLDRSVGPDGLLRHIYTQFNGQEDHQEMSFCHTDYPGRVGPTGAIFNLTFSPNG